MFLFVLTKNQISKDCATLHTSTKLLKFIELYHHRRQCIFQELLWQTITQFLLKNNDYFLIRIVSDSEEAKQTYVSLAWNLFPEVIKYLFDFYFIFSYCNTTLPQTPPVLMSGCPSVRPSVRPFSQRDHIPWRWRSPKYIYMQILLTVPIITCECDWE